MPHKLQSALIFRECRSWRTSSYTPKGLASLHERIETEVRRELSLHFDPQFAPVEVNFLHHADFERERVKTFHGGEATAGTRAMFSLLGVRNHTLYWKTLFNIDSLKEDSEDKLPVSCVFLNTICSRITDHLINRSIQLKGIAEFHPAMIAGVSSFDKSAHMVNEICQGFGLYLSQVPWGSVDFLTAEKIFARYNKHKHWLIHPGYLAARHLLMKKSPRISQAFTAVEDLFAFERGIVPNFLKARALIANPSFFMALALTKVEKAFGFFDMEDGALSIISSPDRLGFQIRNDGTIHVSSFLPALNERYKKANQALGDNELTIDFSDLMKKRMLLPIMM